MSTTDQIYVRFKGRVLGPFDEARIRELVRRGQVTRMHELSSDGVSWVKAEEFGDLLGAGRKSEAKTDRSPELAVENVAQAHAAQARRGTPPDDSVQWYAHLNGANQGPMTTRALYQAAESGQIDAESLVWRSGFDDWKPAAEVLTEIFPAADGVRQSVAAPPQQHALDLQLDSNSQSKGIYYEFGSQRFWVMWLAVWLCFIGSLGAVFWVVFMIAGAGANYGLPGSGSAKVVVGLQGLTLSILITIAGVLLFRYAAALKDIALFRNEHKLTTAARRLSHFWRFVGIVSMVLLALVVVSIALSIAMAMGLGAGVA